MIAVDFGIKYNQIRCLIDCDCQVLVVPWNYDYSSLLKNKGEFFNHYPSPAIRSLILTTIIIYIILLQQK